MSRLYFLNNSFSQIKKYISNMLSCKMKHKINARLCVFFHTLIFMNIGTNYGPKCLHDCFISECELLEDYTATMKP